MYTRKKNQLHRNDSNKQHNNFSNTNPARFVLQTSVTTVVAAQFSRQFSKFFRVIDTLISSKNNDSELKNLLRDAHPVKRLNVDK